MNPETLWNQSADDLQRATASSEPTPGGGSIAAMTAAFGASLVVMALQVTAKRESTPQLTAASERGEQLILKLRAAADEDVVVFSELMDAYGLPRGDEEEKRTRRTAINRAIQRATSAPLDVVDDCLVTLQLAEQVEHLVGKNVVSDVYAGADLLRGAAAAALRTADINVPSLPEGSPLIARRDELAARLESTQPNPGNSAQQGESR